MPRGYFRGQRGKQYGVGRKQARGGHSKQAYWYKTPEWLKKEKDFLRRQRDQDVQCMMNDEINAAFDNSYHESDECFDDNNYCHHGESKYNHASSLTQEYETDETSLASREKSVHADSDLTETEYEDIVMSNDALSEPSYSFCGDSESFSLLSAPSDSNTLSSVSTLWEIVSDTLPSASKNQQCEVHKEDDETSLLSSVSTRAPRVTHPQKTPITLFVPTQCAICLCVKKNALNLFHKCNHPQACLSCLRTHYVTHQIQTQDVSNFPLTCFWPGCHRTLRDTQIRYLVNNQEEMHMFYALNSKAKQMRTDAKAQQQRELDEIRNEAQRVRNEAQRVRNEAKLLQRRVLNFQTLQNCSVCETPNSVYPSRAKCFVCCRTQQDVTVISPEEVKSIVEAVGDALVNCPCCHRLICKDGGCNHLMCVCGNEFSFDKAQKRWNRPYSII